MPSDLTTLLHFFLEDLYKGIVGTTVPITAFRVGDGSASAPSYSFASETTKGMWSSGATILALGGSGSTVIDFIAANSTAARMGSLALIMRDSSVIQWGSSGVSTPDVSLSRGAANLLTLASGDSLSFGGATSSFPKLSNNGAALEVKLADDSAYGVLSLSRLNASGTGAFVTIAGNTVVSVVAPTIGSGFGTSPSVPNANGTAAFTINVGTGGTASSGVITMPAATTGWICHVENLTQTAANRANVRTVQTASTTTSITVQNQTISTGAAVAWTASDVLRIIAFAY